MHPRRCVVGRKPSCTRFRHGDEDARVHPVRLPVSAEMAWLHLWRCGITRLFFVLVVPGARLEVDNITTWKGRPRSSILSMDDLLHGTGSVPRVRARRRSRIVVSSAHPARGGLASRNRVGSSLLMKNCRLTIYKGIKERPRL